jgi:hypothetical protein
MPNPASQHSPHIHGTPTLELQRSGPMDLSQPLGAFERTTKIGCRRVVNSRCRGRSSTPRTSHKLDMPCQALSRKTLFLRSSEPWAVNTSGSMSRNYEGDHRQRGVSYCSSSSVPPWERTARAPCASTFAPARTQRVRVPHAGHSVFTNWESGLHPF